MVLVTLSGRTDCFPTLLVASIVSLYMTGDESIIKAAKKRYLRAELDGTNLMTDRSKPLQRHRIVYNERGPSADPSLHGGNIFASPNASVHKNHNFTAELFSKLENAK